MKYASLTAVVVVLLGGVWWYASRPVIEAQKVDVPKVPEEYELPSFGDTYINNQYRFSLALPEGFVAREMKGADVVTVVLEEQAPSSEMGPAGIQITITPLEEDILHLTKERIQTDIPDMQIEEVQPVEIGDGRSGIAFKSDVPAFGGESREVWFVFDSNLYQISTYARFDALLQTLFTTWKFF